MRNVSAQDPYGLKSLAHSLEGRLGLGCLVVSFHRLRLVGKDR